MVGSQVESATRDERKIFEKFVPRRLTSGCFTITFDQAAEKLIPPRFDYIRYGDVSKMLKLNHLASSATVFGVALLNPIKEMTSRCQRLRKRHLKASRYLSQLWISAATTLLVILSQHPHAFIDVANAASVPYVGVNLAGAEFGDHTLPGTFGKDYIYPTDAEVDYFMGKGMNIFRLPFRWERLQQQQFANFDANELARIDNFVSYATSKGATVLLDPHNYARYYGGLIGQDLPASAFADFWSKLATLYKSNNRVIFGLMNEPHDMPTELWRDDANTAIQAIRNTGATNLILVPGNAWTGAHSWNQSWYGTSNATVMLTITDPGNNYAFEVHQYLDIGFSGTTEQCVSTTIGAEKLAEITAWLKQNGKRGFLGEFSGGPNDTCYNALDNMVSYIDNNADVWLGWTYWAAGPWWGDLVSLEPIGGVDRPQMAVLSKHIGSTPTATPSPSILPQINETPIMGGITGVSRGVNLRGKLRTHK